MQETGYTRVDLQSAYIELYRQMLEYVWPYDTVVVLGELESQCESAFPSKEKCKILLSNLEKTSTLLKQLQNFQYFSNVVEQYDEDTSKVNITFSYNDCNDQDYFGIAVI